MRNNFGFIIQKKRGDTAAISHLNILMSFYANKTLFSATNLPSLAAMQPHTKELYMKD